MNSYVLADKVIQFILNTLVSFLLFSIVTEWILKVFKIQNPRIVATFRLIPVIRLGLEPLFSFCLAVPSVINFSFFSCSHPLQHYLFGLLSDNAKEQLGLYGLKSVFGAALVALPLAFISCAILFVGMVTVYRVVRFVVHGAHSILRMNQILKRGSISLRPIYSIKLHAQLLRKRTEIVVSKEVEVPLAGWGNFIIFPESLVKKLTQNEFEAALSHELEHGLWHDTLQRALCGLVAAFYWWVPMKRWIGKMEFHQEIASDLSIYKYGLKGLDLASALQKAATMQEMQKYQLAALTTGRMIIKRIEAVLDPKDYLRRRALPTICCAGLFLSAALMIGFGIC